MLPSDTSSYSTATEQKIYTTKPSIIIASGLMFKIYGKDPSQHPLKRTLIWVSFRQLIVLLHRKTTSPCITNDGMREKKMLFALAHIPQVTKILNKPNSSSLISLGNIKTELISIIAAEGEEQHANKANIR